MNHISPAVNLCPFLGLRDDADSLVAFPSNSNYCHRNQPVSGIRFSHQEDFCLSKKHPECPVFLREQTTALPEHIRANQTSSKNPQKNIGKSLTAILIMLAIMGALIWTFTGKNLSAKVKISPQVVLPAANTPTFIVGTFELLSESSATPAFLPSPTITGTPTLHIPFFGSVTVTSSATQMPSMTPATFVSRHQLDVPVGTDRMFVIHRLAEKESLDPSVQTYNTSIEAVKSINYYLYLTNPVRRDVLIVFPLNFKDVSGMHVLIIYQIKESERGVNFEYLANRFHVDLKDFKYYNGITDPGDRPLVGDYFLIPNARLVP